MGLPIFHFKQFSIVQHHAAMKVNTDSVLLGAWIDSVDPKTILDIGTGTGILALMMAQRFPDAEIDAVEIDHGACQDARINFSASVWGNRIRLHEADVNQWSSRADGSHRYDLILTNPPFFKNSLLSESMIKRSARHQTTLNILDLLQLASSILSEKGQIALIFPIEGFREIKNAAATCNMYLNRMCLVRSKPESSPHRFLGAFSKQHGACLEEWHTLKAAQGNSYSQEHLDLTEAFYLKK